MFSRSTAVWLLLVSSMVGMLALPALQADGPKDNLPDNVRPIPPLGNELPPTVRTELQTGLKELQGIIASIGEHDLLPDVLVYEKAVRWALDYNEVYDGKGKKPQAGGNVRKVLVAGLERAKQLKDGKTPWTTQTGPVLRGYRSTIDNSVQPYWLIVPEGYSFEGDSRHRLDFWWHGRGETLSEANFLANPQNAQGIIPAPGAFILLPYGRYCNANKFAGEMDTFECLEHASKHYRIDRQRLVARGFSMGGAACWQFGAHYPTLWAACAPGAGFSETPEFLNVFQNEKVEPTWYEKKLWHLYNATDYAQNLFNLPTVAYSGEIDRQKQAADVMAREMKKVGLELTHIIGPNTAHSYEKGAKEEVNRRIDAIVEKGKQELPAEMKFVTYTLRYHQCGPVTITGLVRHWVPASLHTQFQDGVLTIRTTNITGLNVPVQGESYTLKELVIDGVSVWKVNPASAVQIAQARRENGQWALAAKNAPENTLRKIPGLQGPIDDAFMSAFLNVAPTGKPMNEKVGAWVTKEMAHAQDHWRKQFRGDAPFVKDAELTDAQIASHNLVLWGDPSSNAALAKIADKLPIKWTDKVIVVGEKTYEAGTHVPVLIYPNPLNPKKYVVLNSGFTFREYDQLNNARQVPKLPDYAIIDTSTPPNSRYPGKVVWAGFFGENWELLPNDGR